MRLEAAARRLYARQLLLPEIGEAGQQRLCSAGFRAGVSCDAEAYAVAREYLIRAGCPEDERHGAPLDQVAEIDVTSLAGAPFLRAPAAAIVGALLAVEHIKRALDPTTPSMKREFSSLDQG